jgi:DNA uptake protein ComE-like DNA-binding protein
MTHRPMIPAAVSALAVVLVLVLAGSASAQVGKGLIDPNIAPEKTLLTLPHMTPAIAKALTAKRPFAGITALNAFLLDQKLTPQQAADFYGKAFIHVNLNTGTKEEFMLIPGAGARMAAEFAEYRPWKTWAQFDKEIGKYVGPAETNRFKMYLFIPVNINTATDQDILTIPGADERILRDIRAYRPWKSREQWNVEIGRYTDADETARLFRYVVFE